MSYTYEVKRMGSEDGPEVIFRIEDSAWIPTDPSNSDYQEYLKSLDEANTL